jgi:hypothetical protein
VARMSLHCQCLQDKNKSWKHASLHQWNASPDNLHEFYNTVYILREHHRTSSNHHTRTDTQQTRKSPLLPGLPHTTYE